MRGDLSPSIRLNLYTPTTLKVTGCPKSRWPSRLVFEFTREKLENLEKIKRKSKETLNMPVAASLLCFFVGGARGAISQNALFSDDMILESRGEQ